MITIIEIIIAAVLAIVIIRAFPDAPASPPPPLECGRVIVCG